MDEYIENIRSNVDSGSYNLDMVVNNLVSLCSSEDANALSEFQVRQISEILPKLRTAINSVSDEEHRENLNANVAFINQRLGSIGYARTSAGNEYLREAREKQAEYDNLTKALEERQKRIVKLSWLAGIATSDTEQNYSFSAERNKVKKSGNHVLENDLVIERIVVPTKTAAEFAKNADELEIRNSGTDRDEYMRLLHDEYEAFQKDNTRRNALRGELVTLYDKADSIILSGTHGEGMDPRITGFPDLPPVLDPNANLKKLYDRVINGFSSTVGEVKTLEDLFKLSEEELGILIDNLTSNKSLKKDINALEKLAKASAGSNKEAQAILASISNVKIARANTLKIAQQVKEIRNQRITKLNNDITDARSSLATLEAKLLAAEVDKTKYRYILGEITERQMNAFTRKHGVADITLTTAEENDRTHMDDTTRSLYATRIAGTEETIKNLKGKIADVNKSIAGYEKGITSYREGKITKGLRKIINSNKSNVVGMKMIEELNDGITRDTTLRDTEIVATMSDEVESSRKKSTTKGGPEAPTGPSTGGPEAPTGPSTGGPEAPTGPSTGGPEAPTGPSTGDPESAEDKDKDKGKGKDKDRKRLKPKIYGRLPKTAKILAIATGLVAAGFTLTAVFSGGVGAAVASALSAPAISALAAMGQGLTAAAVASSMRK